MSPISTGFIVVNVVGTNEATRQRKFVNARFNLLGQAVDDTGNVAPSKPGLKLNLSGAAKAPDFPAGEYATAQASGNPESVNAVIVKHAEQVEAWQNASGGGTPELQIANAVHAYCIKEEGFLATDGQGYVLSLDNLDVKTDTLESGVLYTVAGTAVFGS